MSNIETSEVLDQAVITRVMKALANPNRLRIFVLLRDTHRNGSGGIRVGEIAATLDVTPSTVSHHLRELEHAGIIRLERQGKTVMCSIECEPLSTVIEGLACDISD